MKQLIDYIQEKLHVSNYKKKDVFKEKLDKIISEYILKEFHYELNKDYEIKLTDEHSDLLIDFDYSKYQQNKLSSKILKDIGEGVSKILKNNWISQRSAPMYKSEDHMKWNHQIEILLW